MEGKMMGVVQESVMPGFTDKSRRYLRLADEQTHRAEAALTAMSRSMYLQLAKQYRELAGQLDDPGRWRARPIPQKPVHQQKR
jgi:hypothetical protein